MGLRCYALSALEMAIRVVSEDQKHQKSNGNQYYRFIPMSEMNTVERFTKGVGSYEASCRKCDA